MQGERANDGDEEPAVWLVPAAKETTREEATQNVNSHEELFHHTTFSWMSATYGSKLFLQMQAAARKKKTMLIKFFGLRPAVILK